MSTSNPKLGGLWASLRGTVLVRLMWESQSTMGGATTGQVVLESTKKQAEQTMGERRVNSMVSASALPGLPLMTGSNL